MTCIVPDAAPLWGQLSVALPSAFPSFRFSRLPRRSIVPFDSVIPAHLALRAALRQSAAYNLGQSLHGEGKYGEAERMFSVLMGEDVERRRQYIEEHALEVKNLDV